MEGNKETPQQMARELILVGRTYVGDWLYEIHKDVKGRWEVTRGSNPKTGAETHRYIPNFTAAIEKAIVLAWPKLDPEVWAKKITQSVAPDRDEGTGYRYAGRYRALCPKCDCPLILDDNIVEYGCRHFVEHDGEGYAFWLVVAE